METANSSTAQQDARASVQKTGDQVVVTVGGDWSIRRIPTRQIDEVRSELERQGPAASLAFRTPGLGSWDSSLILLVSRVEEWCRRHQVRLEEDSLPAGVRDLLALANEVPEKKTGRGQTERRNLLAFLGEWGLGLARGAVATLTFIGEIVLSLERTLRRQAAFDRRLFWLTMQECSIQALPIVSLISFLTGLILAFVGAIQLRQFGAGIYVANLVSVGMTQEMGALMTGIIMAGRTGAAFAAQIGSMKVSEEIDALVTLAISPMDFLVSPRVLALCFMMPLLTLYSDLIGMIGGALVGMSFLNITLQQYWTQTLGAIHLTDIIIGLVKSSVFGVIVAMAGCQRGIECGRDAAAVGNAATSAVVLSITWIVAGDAVLDVLQQALHLK
jgi:phospholipid/cholesterol/gamma-HCH transport system permease protein